MEHEPFEGAELADALQRALDRRPAPPHLKQKIMAARARNIAYMRRQKQMLWMRIAASLLIALALLGGGGIGYRRTVERRKGEEARRQVMIALRITGHALNHVQEKLAAHDRTGD